MACLFDLPQHRFALRSVHLCHHRAGQASMSAAHNRHHHLQIAQQLQSARRRLSFRLRLPLRFEE
jgi:hypothetical protein